MVTTNNDREGQIDPQVTDLHRREYSPHRTYHRLGDAMGNIPDPGKASTAGSQHRCPVQHGPHHERDQEQQQRPGRAMTR